MELSEFLFGIMITIVGVLAVEFITNYYREKKDKDAKDLLRDTLLDDLDFEVIRNGDILKQNVHLWKERKTDRYFLFHSRAFDRIMSHLELFFLNEPPPEGFTPYISCNTYCEEFNRRYGSISGKDRDGEREILNTIGEYLNQINNKIKPPKIPKEPLI